MQIGREQALPVPYSFSFSIPGYFYLAQAIDPESIDLLLRRAGEKASNIFLGNEFVFSLTFHFRFHQDFEFLFY